MLQYVHSSWHASASWEFLKLPTAVLSEPAVAPSPRWQRGVMQMIPIHDLTPSAPDTRRTTLHALERPHALPLVRPHRHLGSHRRLLLLLRRGVLPQRV